MLEVAAIAAGTFAASKGVGMLDKVINKSDSKVMGFVAPAVVTAAGVACAAMVGDKLAKGLGKGVAIGGTFKLAEKALGKENLLAGLEDGGTPLMLPGVGQIGQADLPEDLRELSHFSNNPTAPVTATGNDPVYHMGTPSEVLSGDDDDFIAH